MRLVGLGIEDLSLLALAQLVDHEVRCRETWVTEGREEEPGKLALCIPLSTHTLRPLISMIFTSDVCPLLAQSVCPMLQALDPVSSEKDVGNARLLRRPILVAAGGKVRHRFGEPQDSAVSHVCAYEVEGNTEELRTRRGAYSSLTNRFTIQQGEVEWGTGVRGAPLKAGSQVSRWRLIRATTASSDSGIRAAAL